ncbi:Hypothetical predicted protein [Lecanosticta acicola]|uniref:Uncharacterized protein n=1 Tax=Lecanosticta acicola TaxID=111012 RepID=A0AAI8Z4N6_9PEZI|nr:Hypothetical predicted protein [Lecanosticta acicola]
MAMDEPAPVHPPKKEQKKAAEEEEFEEEPQPEPPAAADNPGCMFWVRDDEGNVHIQKTRSDRQLHRSNSITSKIRQARWQENGTPLFHDFKSIERTDDRRTWGGPERPFQHEAYAPESTGDDWWAMDLAKRREQLREYGEERMAMRAMQKVHPAFAAPDRDFPVAKTLSNTFAPCVSEEYYESLGIQAATALEKEERQKEMAVHKDQLEKVKCALRAVLQTEPGATALILRLKARIRALVKMLEDDEKALECAEGELKRAKQPLKVGIPLKEIPIIRADVEFWDEPLMMKAFRQSNVAKKPVGGEPGLLGALCKRMSAFLFPRQQEIVDNGKNDDKSDDKINAEINAKHVPADIAQAAAEPEAPAASVAVDIPGKAMKSALKTANPPSSLHKLLVDTGVKGRKQTATNQLPWEDDDIPISASLATLEEEDDAAGDETSDDGNMPSSASDESDKDSEYRSISLPTDEAVPTVEYSNSPQVQLAGAEGQVSTDVMDDGYLLLGRVYDFDTLKREERALWYVPRIFQGR